MGALADLKSNQIVFKVGNVHLKEKKISNKLFTQLYSITNNNKLLFDLSMLVHHCEIEHDHQMT